MLEYLQQFAEINEFRYIPNKLGKFPLDLLVIIEETNLCYRPDTHSAKFMELGTIDGNRHILYADIETNLDMNEVINRIRMAREYIILKYVA